MSVNIDNIGDLNLEDAEALLEVLLSMFPKADLENWKPQKVNWEQK